MAKYGERPNVRPGGGRPAKIFYVTLMQRPSHCSCSYGWSETAKSLYLKYKNVSCLAAVWHRNLES